MSRINTSRAKDDTVFDVASKLKEDETAIRNPALPDHHLLLSGELFSPLEREIKKLIGFTVHESITLRQDILRLMQERVQQTFTEADEKAYHLAKEVYHYRSSKRKVEGSSFTEDQLEELRTYSRKEIRRTIYHSLLNEKFFFAGDWFSFSATDLSNFSGIDLQVVQSFLTTFSSQFGDVKTDNQLLGPNTLLKSKPLINHKERYVVPSIPLLTWAVEPYIEEIIKNSRALSKKYSLIKHDFLLERGLRLLRQILQVPQSYTNLYYYQGNNSEKRCEADGLILFDNILFLVEAKGHRLTTMAKAGSPSRTGNFLEEVVKKAYSQGLRTLEYIQANTEAIFYNEKGQRQLLIQKKDIKEYVIVSLCMEPVGNIIPLIKTTNSLGYFSSSQLPWIISIYDLIVMADLIEIPVFLLHYLQRRKQVFEEKRVFVFEELDIFAYYLAQGLYLNQVLNDHKDSDWMYLANETDEINNYYQSKFGQNEKEVTKPLSHLPENFKQLLQAIQQTGKTGRVRIMLQLLEYSTNSINNLMNLISRVKKEYSKDYSLHDCSLYSQDGSLGVTFMAGPFVEELNVKLKQFCIYKLRSKNYKTWIGIGDTQSDVNGYKIVSLFITGAGAN